MITPLSLRYRKKCHVKTRRPHFCTDEPYSFYHIFDRPGQTIFYTLSGVFSVPGSLSRINFRNASATGLGSLRLVSLFYSICFLGNTFTHLHRSDQGFRSRCRHVIQHQVLRSYMVKRNQLSLLAHPLQ